MTAFRSSQRLTITVAQSTLEALIARSSAEGRSVSNLAAYLIESALDPANHPPQHPVA
ncbi:hypothetical protein [Vulcanococcus sp.]|jgi:hypothetical protein|uniref:ribbon-helix-helix domain-containing protein n=1 Tax=Vulcanococcus sp. TaxID=2856995 RepID=UPI0037DA5F6E